MRINWDRICVIGFVLAMAGITIWGMATGK
jgi:hypothetical protein